jgi:AcrR family transcriptional regulator
MAHLSRKERERLRHRREMLEGAEKVFARGGYHGATIQEVAEEAEFSVGALYNMFENKEDIYAQLLEMRIEDFCEGVYARIEAATGILEKVRAVIEAKLDFFQHHRQFLRIFSNLGTDGGAAGPSLATEKSRRLHLDYQERLMDIVSEGMRQGVFAGSSALLLVLSLEGTTNAVLGRWVQAGDTELEEIEPSDVERLVFHGILAKGAG